MTRPVEGSGDPFEYGDDTVAARLSVDIPSDTANSLESVVESTREMRTNMQAIAQAQADYIEYLRQLPQLMQAAEEAGQRYLGATQAALMGATASTAGEQRQRTTSANDAPARGGPWGNNTPGTGTLDTDYRDQLDQLRRDNPRQYANLAAQQAYAEDGRVIHEGGSDADLPEPPRRRRASAGGAGTGPSNRGDRTSPADNRPGSSNDQSGDWLQYAEQFQGRTNNFLNTVFRETAAGGRSTGVQLGATAIGGARSMATNLQSSLEQRATAAEARVAELEQQAAGGHDIDAAELDVAARAAQRARAMTGTAGTLVRGAGVAGLAVGGAMAVQSAGEWYQGMRAQGAQRGGGFGEGMSFEMGVRSMAMNPFISMEQSRKIMQTAMSEGYTGREFDTMTQYMAENLRKMNVDVATSMGVVRNNVIQGGQSLAAAQWDLQTAGALARDPNAVQTSAQFVSQWQQGTQQLVQQGAEGQGASELSLQATALFADNRMLQGIGGNMIEALTTNPLAQQRLMNQFPEYQGPPSGIIDYAMQNGGGVTEALSGESQFLDDLARRLSEQFNSDVPGARQYAINSFMTQAQINGYPVTWNQAEQMLQNIDRGGVTGEIERSQERVDEAATGGELREVNWQDDVKNFGLSVGNIASGVGQGAWGLLQGLWGEGHETRDSAGRAFQRAERAGDIAYSTDRIYTNDRIDQLMSEFGKENIRLRRGDQEMDFDTSNRELMEGLRKGDVQMSVEGGDWTTLAKYSHAKNAEDAAGSAGGGTFDLTPDARRLLQLLPADSRTQTQMGADTGTSGYARNDPAPGEGYGGGG